MSEGEGGPQERALLPACYDDCTAVRARKALALVFVDKDLAPRTIPERIYTQKPCTSVCECPPVCYLASDRVSTPAGPASKSCRPKSRGRPPQNQGPSSPEAKDRVINAVACQESIRTEDFTIKAKKTEAKPARCRAVLNQGARSSVSRAFVRMRRMDTKKGGACYKSPLSRKTQEALHHH